MDTLYCASCRRPDAQWRRQSGGNAGDFQAVCSQLACIEATIGLPISKRRAPVAARSDDSSDSSDDSDVDERRLSQRPTQLLTPTVEFRPLAAATSMDSDSDYLEVLPSRTAMAAGDTDSDSDSSSDDDRILARQTPSPSPLASSARSPLERVRSQSPPIADEPAPWPRFAPARRMATPDDDIQDPWTRPAVPARVAPRPSPLVPRGPAAPAANDDDVGDDVLAITYTAVSTMVSTSVDATPALLMIRVPAADWGRMYARAPWFRLALSQAGVRAELATFMRVNAGAIRSGAHAAGATQLLKYLALLRR